MADRIASTSIQLALDSAKFKQGLDDAGKAMGSFKGQINTATAGIASIFDKLTSTAGLVSVALTGAVGAFAIESIKAFGGAERSLVVLNSALEQTGRYSLQASEQIQDAAAKIQSLTTFDGDDIVKATGQLAKFGTELNTLDLSRAGEAMAGLASTMGTDLDSAAMQLSKTIGGTTNALKRYGIDVDMSASQSDRLNQILEKTAIMFEGAKAETETIDGALVALGSAVGDVMEGFGNLFSSVLGGHGTIRGLTKLVSNLAGALNGMAKSVRVNVIPTLKATAQWWGEAFKRGGAGMAMGTMGVMPNPAVLKLHSDANKGLPKNNIYAIEAKLRAEALANESKFSNKAIEGGRDGVSSNYAPNFRGGAGRPSVSIKKNSAESAESIWRTQNNFLREIDDLVSSASRDYWEPYNESLKQSATITDAVSASIGNYAKRLQDAQSVIESIMTPQQKFQQDVARLDALYQSGFLSVEQFNTAVMRSAESFKILQVETVNAKDNFAGIESAINQYGKTFENTFITALKTGQFSFRDFASSVLEDITRMILRMTVLNQLFGGTSITGKSVTGLIPKAVSGLIGMFGGGGSTAGATAGSMMGSLAGALSGVPGRASGGPVFKNKLYKVGERGPELFVPSANGSIIPNGGGGGVSVTQNITINAGVAQAARQEILKAMPAIQEQAKRGVMDAISSGGKLAKAVGVR